MPVDRGRSRIPRYGMNVNNAHQSPALKQAEPYRHGLVEPEAPMQQDDGQVDGQQQPAAQIAERPSP